MILAVPEHQGRLAPVFDCCRKIVIIDHGPEIDQIISEEDWSELGAHARAQRLRELNIEALVCGGISSRMEAQLKVMDISIYPWISGEVSQVLKALRDGTISDPCYAMPGARQCRRRRRGCSSP